MNSVDTPNINAEFWDELFNQRKMPWDRKQTPAELNGYLTQTDSDKRSVFIPGCGAAYEVASFLRHGFAVMAMDYSVAAVHLAKNQLGEHAHCVLHGDVFSTEISQSFDVIYERAFLAALPRSRWADYFALVERLLPSGGLLLGFFVISDDYHSRFPPFCLRSGELSQWLSPAFRLIESSNASDSVAVFKDKEQWMVWQKN
ncbi:methyltransferase domain-containing protein [Vibrio sp. CAU 1672]|uniref:methyltransferase domain-containing protein n=1 Tax=Vibrio sp. CAU 1672 TaxID=3032594 RepID=UPI0023DBB7D9|nr:methyltransferase domain-containing protein [Vibrio sp. CAU 1672]MDF2155739.1 methyltransferase domain-containing protein [Vibrio sp. CAU 1672]